MLPTALDPVVDRLVRCPAGRTGQPLGLAVDGEVDGALRLPEIDRGDRPRRTQTQSLCEELFHRPRLPGTLPSGKSHPTQIAIDPEIPTSLIQDCCGRLQAYRVLVYSSAKNRKTPATAKIAIGVNAMSSNVFQETGK